MGEVGCILDPTAGGCGGCLLGGAVAEVQTILDGKRAFRNTAGYGRVEALLAAAAAEVRLSQSLTTLCGPYTRHWIGVRLE
eukprot:SAG22_NODE_3804_length_1525_cov_2.293829_2_plen_81_part_00